jgi:hypothetical protein
MEWLASTNPKPQYNKKNPSPRYIRAGLIREPSLKSGVSPPSLKLPGQFTTGAYFPLPQAQIFDAKQTTKAFQLVSFPVTCQVSL